MDGGSTPPTSTSLQEKRSSVGKEQIVELYEEARKITSDTLSGFVAKVLSLPHDYNTIADAIAIVALAGAYAVENSSKGGVTWFQSGCAGWRFLVKWNRWDDSPRTVVNYREMLFPQHEYKFTRTITEDTWEFLQKEAADALKDSFGAAEEVKEHWESIVAGVIPFGYSIEIKND